MKNYQLEATENSPFVYISSDEGLFHINGKSNCIDSKSFYDPLIQFIDELTDFKNGELKCVFQFDYLSQGDSKMILFIFQKLKALQIEGWDIKIDWNVYENDLFLLAIAEDFEYMLDMKININDIRIGNNVNRTKKAILNSY